MTTRQHIGTWRGPNDAARRLGSGMFYYYYISLFSDIYVIGDHTWQHTTTPAHIYSSKMPSTNDSDDCGMMQPNCKFFLYFVPIILIYLFYLVLQLWHAIQEWWDDKQWITRLKHRYTSFGPMVSIFSFSFISIILICLFGSSFLVLQLRSTIYKLWDGKWWDPVGY